MANPIPSSNAVPPNPVPALQQQIETNNNKAKAEIQAEQAQMKPVIDQLHGMDSQPPPVTHMEAMPAVPEKPNPEAFAHYAGMALLFSSLAGLATNLPVTTAIQSLGSAMKGFSKGQMDEYALNMQQYKTHMQSALEQNSQQIAQASLVLNNRKMDEQSKMNELKMIALEHGNTIALTALDNKNLMQVAAVYEKLQQTQATMEEKTAALEAQNAYRESMLGLGEKKNAQAQEKINAKGMTIPATEAPVLISTIDNIMNEIRKNPSNVGAAGIFKRVTGSALQQGANVPVAGGLIKGAGLGNTSVGMGSSEIEAQINILKSQLYKVIAGSGVLTKAKIAILDAMIPGTGIGQSAQQVLQKLQVLKQFIRDNSGQANPSLTGTQAPQFSVGQTVIHNGKKYRVTGIAPDGSVEAEPLP